MSFPPPVRRRTHLLAWSAATAVALGAAVAPISPFDAMVVFGDSISDGGSYADRARPPAPAASPPGLLFERADSDGDGVVSPPELSAFQAVMQPRSR